MNDNIKIEEYLEIIKKNRNKFKNFDENAPNPKSTLIEMKFINEKLEKNKKPKDFQFNHEWCSNFLIWFSHLRSFLKENNIKNENFEFNSIIRKIESGEPPLNNDFNDSDIGFLIINYFITKNKNFEKNDLIWIFYSLAKIDLLLIPNQSISLQNLLILIYQNFNKNSELFSYLNILIIIITQFFNQK